MMQYRLSTLLLAFVVVWASLAVSGSVGGIVVAVVLLAAAAYIRAAKSTTRAVIRVVFVLFGGFCLFGVLRPGVAYVSGAVCTNHLGQIGCALYNYESANGRFPPAVVADERGNAMHSWRTLILPYLGEPKLYGAFTLGEPWYSPKNSKAAAELVPVFRCPTDRSITDHPMTSYVAVTGPGTAWDDQRFKAKPPRVIVVEVVSSGIQWAEPRDISLDDACRGADEGGGPVTLGHTSVTDKFFVRKEAIRQVRVLRSDGSVRIIPAGLPRDTVRGLFLGADERTWETCEEVSPVVEQKVCVNWTNCASLAVLVLSYAVLLFRRRDKLPPQTEPAIPGPAAAADRRESGE